MLRSLSLCLLIAAPLAVASAQAPPPAGDNSAARLFPSSTVAYVELPNPIDLVSTIFDHPLREEIESLAPYQMAMQSPQYQQFETGRAMLEGQLGMPWRDAAEKLLAYGVAAGFDPATEGAALIFHGKDAESMELFRDRALALALLGDKDKVKKGEYREVQAYQFNGVWVAVHQDRLLVTNKSETGRAVIDRLLDGGESLADNPRFAAASKSRPSGSAAWGFVDVQFVREANIANDLFNSQVDNPVGELLVGGIQSSLKATPYATASLTANHQLVGLTLSAPYDPEWIPEEREYYFGPAGDGKGPALPDTTDTLFTLSTYRNFSEMWLRAGDLYGVEINDGFAKADATLTTFFAGRDFGEDILGSFENEVGFIATRTDFSEVLPRPTIKIPAFAVIFRLKEPETMTRELRRTFQSLIGFLNVVGAMNGQRQLEMDMEKIGDHAELITTSYVPEEDDRESTEASIAFNFSPSIGFAGERFVVASTASLARQLTLAKPTDAKTIDANTHAKLNAGILRDVLADNREQLIAQNMLEDGNSREEAEAIIELILQVAGYFEGASIELAATDGQLQAEAKIQVKP